MKQTALADRDAPVISREDILLRKFPAWSMAHWCVVVFAASFLILALHPEARLSDFDVPNGAEPVRVARSLAANGAFANPFASLPTGTTAHVAPVYPFLYSLVLRVLGTGHAALQAMWVFNVWLVALQMALLPLLSHRLGLGISSGVAAAALGSVSHYAPIDTRWESFLSGTLLLWAFLTTDRALREKSIGKTVAAGGCWGVLVLTNPVAVVVLLSSLMCFGFFATERVKIWHRCASILGIALLIVSPWIARNYARFGVFIFVRDNLGLELYTGNNSCAAPDLRTNIQSGCHARTHPNASRTVAAQLAAVGEVAFYHAKLHEAVDWIANHRAAFLYLTVRRVRLFWFPETERWREAPLVWTITLLSLLGVWLIRRKNFAATWMVASVWCFFPLVYYMIPFEPRYRCPIYWTSLLPAGYAMAELVRRFSPIRETHR